jgi:hypothetical protein
MKHNAKFSNQQQQLDAALAQSKPAFREFATVEDMLRHDAIHTPVPPAIAHRLTETVSQLASSRKPWWRRFTGTSE